ncbi:hypothetical protein F8M41_020620 [Gigaspora margarita]|uniref:Uncharacterized protein n=1 Tax=Gigaspora margarita TaxID=4874 RepID=A0A8H4EJP5_GIGMA|nr:hypothetical protein F8M41_020620 [Gigaspora margarita]
MVFIETLVEGKILVKALIDTSSKLNTISKRLFDKLKSNHGIHPSCSLVNNLYGDVIDEINCLDLQFHHKAKWQSLDRIDAIEFEIRKNSRFNLVLGQGWLWIHEVEMSFKLSHKENFDSLAKIIIDSMCIPLIDKDFNKVSPSKNNSSNSMESRSNPTLEEFVDMFKKLSLRNKDNMHRKKRRGIFHNKPHVFLMPRWIKSETETNSSSSDSESTDSNCAGNKIGVHKFLEALGLLDNEVVPVNMNDDDNSESVIDEEDSDND